MSKLLIALLLLLSSLCASAQGPPSLENFTSSDGTFQFMYPENYQLLVGERILRATQGRPRGMPVCDFSTALVCIVYPIQADDGKLEAAGFSVGSMPGAASVAECLAGVDPATATRGAPLHSSLVRINGTDFLFARTKKSADGHMQAGYTYRTYQKDRCYELRIAVSLSDEANPQHQTDSNSLGDPLADSARESLKLILGSFFFKE